MKKYAFSALVAVVSLLAACRQEVPEEIIPGDELKEIILKADLADSKVLLDGYSLTWAEGDRIAVFDGEAVREFSLVSGAGTKTASFSGSISASAGILSAIYPYSAATLDGGSFDATVPSVQTPGAGGADSGAIVMTADFRKGENIHFLHATSLLRFSVPSGITSVLFSSPGSALSGSESVTVNLSGAAGEYSAAVISGEYKGIVALLQKDGQWFSKYSGNTLELEAGSIIRLGNIDSDTPAVIIRTAEEMSDFLGSCNGKSDPDAFLFDDIDLAGSSNKAASDFSGRLYGLGHTVSNLASPLFKTNHGRIDALVLEGALSVSEGAAAPLAVSNYGTVSGVVNKARVVLDRSSEAGAAIVLGGIAAYNYGSIEDSSNEAEVALQCASAIMASAVGGIAGYSQGPVTGCDNSGSVSISASYGKANSALGAMTAASSSLGGIVGAAWDGNSNVSCTNSGSVSFEFSRIDLGTGTYSRSQIGGVCGSCFGDITDSSNSGTISVTAVSGDRSAVSATNYIYDIGGITGGAGHQTSTDKDATNVTNCHNTGEMSIVIDAMRSNSPIGGIIGWPCAETYNTKCTTTSCTNRGNITMEGAGKVRIGGIMGGTGSILSSSNYGKIHVVSADFDSSIGGIQGFHSRYHELKSCSNEGDVISDAAIWAAGGLLGSHGGVDLTSGESCSVNCNVANGAETNAGTGIVLGSYNKETTKAVVLGTVANPIDVKGSISYGINTIVIDADTYLYFLSGTDYYTSKHVINAVCSVPSSGSAFSAEGYVKYSDGSAASGISVSDGFNVTVTDASGYYSVKTRSDTRYIYISLPSDAKVGKKDNGTPDFYVKYVFPLKRYDFTLTRQAVEDNFLLFAMADPQAHYSIRGDQPIADTKRFGTESVPAINAHIAGQSLPCYGVTLGDIVYSEGSRNSNNGMSEMAGYFGNINMPVFQTMGNHDYTYFYTSSPLTTAPGTSTLYLQAQRRFEDTFGPVNFSFNRGDVHVVCMRNIIYDSDTDASSYHCGYTDEQFAWLKADLANVPKSKMVIICGHIPLLTNTSREHVSDILQLLKTYSNAKIFSGHTHYKRYSANVSSSGVAEHIHGAVCGQWWWSNFQGDGCPNGYYVYELDGTEIKDEYFMGVNNHMNTRDYQIRVYKGNLKTGGKYAYFQWQNGANVLMINVFNGDSRWKVQVYENGTLGGNATLKAYNRHTWNSVSAGSTYAVPTASSQDWWAIGYHIGVRGRGVSNTSYYTSMFHMYTYTLKDPSASVEVVATDGYGNKYSTKEVFSTDLFYPDYIKQGNVN